MHGGKRATGVSDQAPEPDGAMPRRPLVLRVGKRLRRTIDRMVARSSIVPNDPVLDATLFNWSVSLREHWRDIRDEALAVTRDTEAVPALAVISPDHKRIATDDKWRSFFLIGYGTPITDNIARCPKTVEMLKQVPGLNSGFFSILEAGTHIPQHRGVTKGLLTCHLGLLVPGGSGLRMTVGSETVGWEEGETLLFDDTYPHEVWNDTAGTRIVLLIQFERPLRQPGRALARAFLGAIRRTSFVKETVVNIALWESRSTNDGSHRDLEPDRRGRPSAGSIDGRAERGDRVPSAGPPEQRAR